MKNERLKVTVTMEGGVIHDIAVPDGVEVTVLDFDTEGIEDRFIHTSETDGSRYTVVIHTSNGTVYVPAYKESA